MSAFSPLTPAIPADPKQVARVPSPEAVKQIASLFGGMSQYQQDRLEASRLKLAAMSRAEYDAHVSKLFEPHPGPTDEQEHSLSFAQRGLVRS
jgi:hypothetical protein